jgi:5-dehydro-2-deoxygluconokinase
LVLGSTATRGELVSLFGVLAAVSCIRGFAIGRAIFSDTAARWLTGELSDTALVDMVASDYRRTIAAWTSCDDHVNSGQEDHR